MARVFFDTNLFIYFFEGHLEFAPEVQRIRQRMIERGDSWFTSVMSVAETLVRPIEMRDTKNQRLYMDFFQSDTITVLPFESRSAELYALLRNDRRLRTPDAIQLACAGTAGIDLFITNDERLSNQTVPGITFIATLKRCPI